MRGSVPNMLIPAGSEMVDKYFAKGTPIGLRLFDGYPESIDDVIVKFGQRDHIERMLNNGELRGTPSTLRFMVRLSGHRPTHAG